jgi:hypothetical protein
VKAMNKSSKIKSALLQSIWGFGSFILFALNWYISLYSDKARKDFGDSFMNWYSDLPAPLIGLILAIIFMGFVIFELYKVGIFGNGKNIENKPSEPKIKIEAERGSVAAKEINAPITIRNKISVNDKKRKVLNKLDWHVKQVVNEIVLRKSYTDKETSVRKKYNEFRDFYQNNPAEISLVLEKLVEEITLEMRKEIEQFPKVHGTEDKLKNLCDKIHEEIYNTFQT